MMLDDCRNCNGSPSRRNTSPFGGRYLVLLCPSGPLLKPPRRQAFASAVVVEPRLLVPPQPTGHGPADVGRAVAPQEPVQHLSDRPPDLRHGQRRGRLFSPAGLPASGTTPRSGT